MSMNVYLEFSTDKKMTEDMVFAVSEKLQHLGASLGINSCFTRGSAEMTLETNKVHIAFDAASNVLRREFEKFDVTPQLTAATIGGVPA